MKCPNCGSDNTRCVDSRAVLTERRRRYKCLMCNGTFRTTERVAVYSKPAEKDPKEKA